MLWFLTGGFAKGYRTYILAGLSAAGAIAAWSVGDANLQDTLNTLWQLGVSAGLGTARAGLPAK